MSSKWYEEPAVQFMRPMPVTNSACCSDSRVMCEKCAAAALAAGHSRQGRGNSNPAPTSNAEDDLLIPPSIDWQQLSEERATRREEPSNMIVNEDEDTLPIPSFCGY